ncbi:MAG TPA: hypothetical protein VGD29_18115 [Actinoplanes sp.]|jgi:hypothetical protein
MRKLLLTAAAAVTVFAAMPTAGVQAATKVESVIGAGTLNQFGTPTAYLAAVGNQRGQLGAFTITYPDGTYASGMSSCLVVDAKTAYLTGKITLSGGPRRETNSWQRGNYLVIGVQDNGDGTVVADELNFSTGTETDPGCGPKANAIPVFFIVKGNYRVTDAG